MCPNSPLPQCLLKPQLTSYVISRLQHCMKSLRSVGEFVCSALHRPFTSSFSHAPSLALASMAARITAGRRCSGEGGYVIRMESGENLPPPLHKKKKKKPCYPLKNSSRLPM